MAKRVKLHNANSVNVKQTSRKERGNRAYDNTLLKIEKKFGGSLTEQQQADAIDALNRMTSYWHKNKKRFLQYHTTDEDEKIDRIENLKGSYVTTIDGEEHIRTLTESILRGLDGAITPERFVQMMQERAMEEQIRYESNTINIDWKPKEGNYKSTARQLSYTNYMALSKGYRLSLSQLDQFSQYITYARKSGYFNNKNMDSEQIIAELFDQWVESYKIRTPDDIISDPAIIRDKMTRMRHVVALVDAETVADSERELNIIRGLK